MKAESDAKGFVQTVSAQTPTRRTSTTSSPKKKSFFNFSNVEETNNDVKKRRIEIFYERKSLAIDRKFEYERNGSEPGLVLIFNQENFDDTGLRPRRGSRRDVEEIIICKQRHGINISRDNILIDATTDQITAKLKKVAEMDLTEYNFLIVYFLTHGDEYNVLNTKDGTIRTHEVWAPFKRCKSLDSKPKMFVFQACKAESASTTTGTTSDVLASSDIVPLQSFKTDHLSPDMLVVYSTIEGKVSFRHPLIGSWFIQELCKNINIFGKRDDVISLIIRTTKCVCGNYYLLENQVFKKQMPMFLSTLSKKFYLNRNKDRDHVLKTVEHYRSTVEELETIKIQLKTLLNDK